jgi:hypothetical protein
MKILLTLLASVSLLSPLGASEFFVHDGDRVVFLGDSITEQRLYTTYIEAYTLSRHPTWKLEFRNVGWGGDTAWLRMRSHPDENQLFAADEETQSKMVLESVDFGLKRDVLPLKPTVVTVDFGMNDHAYQALRPDILRAYVSSQTQIARELTANGAKVAFITPQPIEEKRPDPDQDVKNISLKAFSEALRGVALQQHALFADEFDPYMQAMIGAKGTIGGGDSVHPGPAGHTIMAWAILKALGATPLVSTATINPASLKAEDTEGCRIDNIRKEGATLRFDRLDDALPMPVDPKAEPALALVPITHDLNRYELKVPGLPEGSYSVSIDGEPAATVTAKDLEQGWNLAYSAGPITKQSQDLLSLVYKKNNLYYERWRNVHLFKLPDWLHADADVETRRDAEAARLDKEIAALEAKIDAVRIPKTHHFAISPASGDSG